MSFFRVLLALLISGGIAYGLYRAVDGKGFDTVVEAVRAEIEEPLGLAPADTAEDGTPEEDAPQAAAIAEIPESENAQTTGAPETQPAADEDTPDAEQDTQVADTPEASEQNDESSSTEADENSATASFTERTEEVLVLATPPATPAQPTAPEADIPVSDEQTDGGDTPTLIDPSTGAASSDSADALDVINGGMSYIEARETMIEAGWVPRLPAERNSASDATETALIEAGYGELEGCSGDERPLCRFEFVDGEKRIAAVLTAGTGIDPSVIDAYLMTIRAE